MIVVALLLLPAWLTAGPRPQLVILISVDQMREDYFDRFIPFYTGGLRQLYGEGLYYSNAGLNYASSATCLGHAALSTGAYPRTNGILENEWVNPVTRRSVYCVEDTTVGEVDGEGGGASPENLLATTIGDWLKASSPKSKVISAAGKDRAAILLGGKHADYAFWYNRKSGHMVTSSYYATHVPPWVRTFNDYPWIERNVPTFWTKFLPESAYVKEGPDEFVSESKTHSSSSFPHSIDEGKKREQLLGTPYGDLFLLDFVREAVRAENLGQRGVTDLLCLGISGCDYVGHAYGPNSHEIMDYLVRLDRALGSFFADIDKIVGRDNVFVVLSADHGVMPLPEFLTQYRHVAARRISYKLHLKKQVDSVEVVLKRELKTEEQIFETGGFLNYDAAARAGWDSVRLEKRIGDLLRSVDGIADIYFRRELMDPRTPSREYLDKFRNSYYPPRGEDYQIRFCEYCLISSSPTGTSHGSVYSYDTHVPVAFWGAGTKSGRVTREVHTVDIAPTIARVLNLEYPKTVDGTPLNEFK